jgi:hypothetical protein
MGSATWAVAGIVNELQSFPARHNSTTQLKGRRLKVDGRVEPAEFVRSKMKLNRATFAIEPWCI